MKVKFADRKGGFPHSEICGSKGARASPHLIAACHVLHRLSTPRHPLEALSRLIVLSKTHARSFHPPKRTELAFHALCICQTMMSFLKSTLNSLLCCGLTLHSRCQLDGPDGLPRNLFSRSRGMWWSQTGSNRRPHACKARALPTELWPLFTRKRAR